MSKYIVYSELWSETSIDKHYFGTFPNEATANRVAEELEHEPFRCYYGVCPLHMAEYLGVQNMPV